MAFKHFYPKEEDNFGSILAIIDCEDGGEKLVQCSLPIGTVDISACLNFNPEVGMQVELLISDEGWFLRNANHHEQLKLVPDKWKPEFATFVDSGEASSEFLAELDRNEDMLKACEMVLQADVHTANLIREALKMTPQTQSVVEEVVREWVQNGKMFTSYEVYTAARERGVQERYYQLRGDIHQTIYDESVALANPGGSGNYTRILMDVGAPTQAWLYYRDTDDPYTYQPLDRSGGNAIAPVGSQPLMLPAVKATPLVNDQGNIPADAYGVDQRGRLCLPVKLLREIGVAPKDQVTVTVDGKTLNVSKLAVPATDDDTTYTAEPDGNVRLTQATLGKSGIAGLQCYRIVELNGQIQVSEF